MLAPVLRVFSVSEILQQILVHLSPLDMQALCQAWKLVRNSQLWKSRAFFAHLGLHQLGRKFYTERADYLHLYCTLYKLHHTSLGEVHRQQPMRDSTMSYRLDRRYRSKRSHTFACATEGIFLPTESPGQFSGAFVYCTGKIVVFLKVDAHVFTTVVKEHVLPARLEAFSISPDGRYLLCLLESLTLAYFILDDGNHATFVETDWKIGFDDFNQHMFLDQHHIMWPGQEGIDLCRRSLRIGHRLRALQRGDDFFYHTDIDLFGMRIDQILNNRHFLNLAYRAFTDADSGLLQLVHTIGCGKKHYPHKMVWVSNPDSHSCTSHFLVANGGFIVNAKPSPNNDCVFVKVITDSRDPREDDLEFVSRQRFSTPCTWTYDKHFQRPSISVFQVAPGKPIKRVFWLKNHIWCGDSLFDRRDDCLAPCGGLQSDYSLSKMFNFVVTKHFIVVDRGSTFVTNYTADNSPVYKIFLGHNHAYSAVSDDLQTMVTLEDYYNDARGHAHGFRLWKLRYDQELGAIGSGYHWNRNLQRDASTVKCLPIKNQHTYAR